MQNVAALRAAVLRNLKNLRWGGVGISVPPVGALVKGKQLTYMGIAVTVNVWPFAPQIPSKCKRIGAQFTQG